MQATVKCTWQFGVVERNLILESELRSWNRAHGNGACHRPSSLPPLRRPRVQLQAELCSSAVASTLPVTFSCCRDHGRGVLRESSATVAISRSISRALKGPNSKDAGVLLIPYSNWLSKASPQPFHEGCCYYPHFTDGEVEVQGGCSILRFHPRDPAESLHSTISSWETKVPWQVCLLPDSHPWTQAR